MQNGSCRYLKEAQRSDVSKSLFAPTTGFNSSSSERGTRFIVKTESDWLALLLDLNGGTQILNQLLSYFCSKFPQ